GEMDAAAFWNLIEATKRASENQCEQHAQLLQQQLVQLPPEEILSFDRLLSQFMNMAHSDHLWAAAYLINGGCSDDGFMDFRGWLIGGGETVFYAAMQNPDTLAEVIAGLPPPRDTYECEDLLYVALHAYEAKTGQEMPLEEPPSLDLAGESLEAEVLSEQ